MFRGGVEAYLLNFWKLLDLTLIFFYLLSVAFRTIGYLQVRGNGLRRETEDEGEGRRNEEGEGEGRREKKGEEGRREMTAREEKSARLPPPPSHPPV